MVVNHIILRGILPQDELGRTALRSAAKKGILITIGDDCCHRYSHAEISRVSATASEYDLSDEELIAAAEEKYHVFHICIDKGLPEDERIFADWREILPGRTAVINKKTYPVFQS